MRRADPHFVYFVVVRCFLFVPIIHFSSFDRSTNETKRNGTKR